MNKEKRGRLQKSPQPTRSPKKTKMAFPQRRKLPKKMTEDLQIKMKKGQEELKEQSQAQHDTLIKMMEKCPQIRRRHLIKPKRI